MAFRRRTCRKIERGCCNVLTYFPLAFVYGLTSWAAWVEVGIGFVPSRTAWTGKTTSLLGFVLYLLLNWSYTTAVFTDPGSPMNPRSSTRSSKGDYNSLPTTETGDGDQPPQFTSFTVKGSTGHLRYCKKCLAHKPDRTHHCSTCRRCVLKMDHHCPWLATCVGLHNYKPFLLFLIYVTLFCWLCCAVSSSWVWREIINEGQFSDTFMPVNYVLLAVLSGIIGIVITGFTAWHLYLTVRGQTTIESLEKTRYLSPVKDSMSQQLQDRNYIDAQAQGRLSIGDQLREIHANVLPGVTRPEEGEAMTPPSVSPTPQQARDHELERRRRWQHDYEARQREREQSRYADYLDDRDNDLLPNAFDLGPRRNLLHVFGERPLLWAFPIRTTTGDGWSWEPSPKWLAARDRIAKEREEEDQTQRRREREAGWGMESPTEADFGLARPMRGDHGQRDGYVNGYGDAASRGAGVADGWQVNAFSPPTPRLPRPSDGVAPPRRHGESAQYLTTSASIATSQQHAYSVGHHGARRGAGDGLAASPSRQGRRSPATSKADQILGREADMYADADDGIGGTDPSLREEVMMRDLRPPTKLGPNPMGRGRSKKGSKFDQYSYISEDEDDDGDGDDPSESGLASSHAGASGLTHAHTITRSTMPSTSATGMADWNDVPDEFLDGNAPTRSASARRGKPRRD